MRSRCTWRADAGPDVILYTLYVHGEFLVKPHLGVIRLQRVGEGIDGPASMSWPVTEAELAHYEEVMEILKSRWSGIPAEAKVKMATVNDDSVQREESFNEFKALWACHANSDGTLTREQFCVFNHKHLSNIKARLGWAPDLTKVDSEHIWEAIHALHPDISGISLAAYSRYHAVMKNYIR